MAPYSNVETHSETPIVDDQINSKNDNDDCHQDFQDDLGGKEEEVLSPLKIKWFYVLLLVYYTISFFYGLYLVFTAAVKWQTVIFTIVLDALAVIGAMAGAHRLWSHRAYKATTTLKVILATFFTLSLQHSIYEFAQDHRVHHKYSDTDADPHNINRGLFYAHQGWVLTEKSEACKKRTAEVDMSDLDADPIVQFQQKYYKILIFIIAIIMPTLIPMYLWNETFICAFFVATQVRIGASLHQIFLINSLAHKWGYKPYDKSILSSENVLVSFFSGGEGFHNYHHTFPWDYSASEFGTKYNLSTAFLNLMAWLGLAYDLRTASKSLIEARKIRTGDKSVHQPIYETGIESISGLKVTKED